MQSLIQQATMCVFMYRLFAACFTTFGYSDKGKITKEKPDKMIVNLAKGSKLSAWELMKSREYN
jgi:hypothetical protein